MAAKTFGVGPDQGYIATRDRLRNYRITGSMSGPEDPEHWFTVKTSQPMSSRIDDARPMSRDYLPDWLQLI